MAAIKKKYLAARLTWRPGFLHPSFKPRFPLRRGKMYCRLLCIKNSEKPEDGGSMYHRNVVRYLPICTTSLFQTVPPHFTSLSPHSVRQAIT